MINNIILCKIARKSEGSFIGANFKYICGQDNLNLFRKRKGQLKSVVYLSKNIWMVRGAGFKPKFTSKIALLSLKWSLLALF